MIHELEKGRSAICWQEAPEDGVPESAVYIRAWSGCIELRQGEHSIQLNYESASEFAKYLRTLKEPD